MTEIKPALTAEEWADRRRFKEQHPNQWPAPSDLLRQIATFNDLLPDDDPRKITRADVEELQEAVSFARYHSGDDNWPLSYALAAKLAALLPPEPEAR